MRESYVVQQRRIRSTVGTKRPERLAIYVVLLDFAQLRFIFGQLQRIATLISQTNTLRNTIQDTVTCNNVASCQVIILIASVPESYNSLYLLLPLLN